MRRLIVCADDFGQGPQVDEGILALARAGRLTAVSCLARGPAFRPDLPALLATGADPGLHLDLTEGFDGAPRARLVGLVLRSHLGWVDREAVRRHLRDQLEAFEAAAGRPPVFVDGHQHVHQLPVVRGLLLAELRRRYPTRPPLVRVTVPRRARGAKAALLAALGGRALRRALQAQGLPHNPDFAGVYDFDPRAPYRALVQGWLGSLADGGLLMCHPGRPSHDAISAARVAELAYLGSDAFEADCAAAGVTLVPPRALLAPAGG